MDIGLPVLNGYEVAERLRQQPELNDMRLLAVSGYGRPDDCERSKLAGFDHRFAKPVGCWRVSVAIRRNDLMVRSN